MSKEESQQNWAAIVYGRSYHLDFRFITIPQDFTPKEISWASNYILATTQKARNLVNYPRWSLFKNDSHCVVGVTCMVRDLLGNLEENSPEVLGKDDCGRPLYIFVGYVTQLNGDNSLSSCPAYTGNYLNNFQPLYQEIKKVWLLRDYQNRQPHLSQYELLNPDIEVFSLPVKLKQTSFLNHQLIYPQKTFVWQQLNFKDWQLWQETANCHNPTSICLNIKGKPLANSPFLNQTVTEIHKFTIQPRITHRESNSSNVSSSESKAKLPTTSFKDKITTRAKEDLDLTIQQAVKVTSASQEVINNLTNWSNSAEQSVKRSPFSQDNSENFGFKNKPKSLPSKKQDWF